MSRSEMRTFYTFLFLKHVLSHHGRQHTLYMCEVEVGRSTPSVLWVDDQIFNDNWDNIKYMINAEAKDPKKSTSLLKNHPLIMHYHFFDHHLDNV
jgi:hypothetical protein